MTRTQRRCFCLRLCGVVTDEDLETGEGVAVLILTAIYDKDQSLCGETSQPLHQQRISKLLKQTLGIQILNSWTYVKEEQSHAAQVCLHWLFRGATRFVVCGPTERGSFPLTSELVFSQGIEVTAGHTWIQCLEF